MKRLDTPKVIEFSKSDFEKYPVWVWNEEMEYKLPITEKHPSRYDYGVFFIKCQFSTSEHLFDGYLIGNKLYYAFGIFVNEIEFVFNINTPKLNQVDLRKISNILGYGNFSLFPLTYKSSVSFEDGLEISGVLDFRSNEEKHT